MIFELCKGKTKCKECGDILKKGEIRGVYGRGYYSDPYVYNCLTCCKKSDINLNSLINCCNLKIKEYTMQVEKLKKLKKEI